jgi:hypothetical protein
MVPWMQENSCTVIILGRKLCGESYLKEENDVGESTIQPCEKR